VRLADGYLVYLAGDAQSLVGAGFPRDRIAAVNNTVDVELQRQLRREVENDSPADIRKDFGLPADGPVLLYFGRFLPQKHVELAIDYIRHAKAAGQKVSLLISGGGPEKDNLEKRAEGLDTVIFRWLDDRDLARAMRIASAIVIPGFVGLAITHGFVHGVPVVTRDVDHPPEIRNLNSGENGLILPADVEEFFAGLDDYLADLSLQQHLRAGALTTAEQLSMDGMAASFNNLVRLVSSR
jgi:glycosyltransferase involved in cell wall biosynthesis